MSLNLIDFCNNRLGLFNADFSPVDLINRGFFMVAVMPILHREERAKGDYTRMKRTQKMVTLSMLGSISFVLMLLNFPLPFLPNYLKIDFSDVPALIAAIMFSPIAGVIVEALKNVLYYIFRGSGVPVGELANFAAGVAFILPVSWFYHKKKSTKGLATGLVAGTITMALGLAILNYILILPAYAWFFGMDYMLDPAVKWTTITAGILPFNIIKAMFISALFIPLFLKLKPWMMRRQQSF